MPVSLERNSATVKKMELEIGGGQKFFPQNHLLFCQLERLDFKIRIFDFRQKKFELRSKNTALCRDSI